MTETIDPHPDVLEPVTSSLPAPQPVGTAWHGDDLADVVSRCRCPSPATNARVGTCERCGKPLPKTEADREAQAAEAKAIVDVAVEQTKIGLALSRMAQYHLDRELRELNLGHTAGSWSVAAKAWLKDESGKPGFLRLTLRLVAERASPTDGGASAEQMTEEHHALIDRVDLVDAAAIANVFQEALGELVGITAPKMEARLRKAGVLDWMGPPCSGDVCVGCGRATCPRTLERQATCDHSAASGNKGALRCTLCGTAIGLFAKP